MSADGMVRPCTCLADDGSGRAALHRKFAANVADGSKADIVKRLDDVHLTPESGHCEPIVAPSRLV
jgi:hypothetical protein